MSDWTAAGLPMTATPEDVGLSSAGLEGQGYGLGVGVTVEPSETPVPGSPGTYGWAGVNDTWFWIDPAKELIGIYMAQFDPVAVNGVAAEFWSLVCRALTD